MWGEMRVIAYAALFADCLCRVEFQLDKFGFLYGDEYSTDHSIGTARIAQATVRTHYSQRFTRRPVHSRVNLTELYLATDLHVLAVSREFTKICVSKDFTRMGHYIRMVIRNIRYLNNICSMLSLIAYVYKILL